MLHPRPDSARRRQDFVGLGKGLGGGSQAVESSNAWNSRPGSSNNNMGYNHLDFLGFMLEILLLLAKYKAFNAMFDFLNVKSPELDDGSPLFETPSKPVVDPGVGQRGIGSKNL